MPNPSTYNLAGQLCQVYEAPDASGKAWHVEKHVLDGDCNVHHAWRESEKLLRGHFSDIDPFLLTHRGSIGGAIQPDLDRPHS